MATQARQSSTPRLSERIRDSARLVRQALRLAWRASPWLVLGLSALILVQALLPPLQLGLLSLVVERAAADAGLTAPAPDALAAQLPLATWIWLAAAAVAAGQLMQPFATACGSLAGQRLNVYVMKELIRAANRWPGIARFEDPHFADDLLRARQHASRSGLDLVENAVQALVTLGTAASLVLVLFGLHPLIPLLVVLTSLPRVSREWEYIQSSNAALNERAPEARRLAYARDALLTPELAKDVRLYDLGPFFFRQYEDAFQRMLAPLDDLRRRLTLGMSLSDALGTAGSMGAFVATVWFVATGQRTLGDVALYGGAASLLYLQCLFLGSRLGALPGALAFLPSLFRVLDAPPDLPLPTDPRPAPRPMRTGIVFDHVSFAYPAHADPPTPNGQDTTGDAPPACHPPSPDLILHDLSFRVAPGECLALVGHNGAGKTTIIKLLLRLYDPSAGRILLDGVDLRAYDLDALRRQMAVVFQDFVRYELTSGQNIGLGRLESLGDRPALLDAAARAGALALVEGLPRGLDTPLGRELGGRELSGGEWQKLALARAFLRATGDLGAQILVLDEPTAALDVQTEYEVYTRFRDLTRGRTTLLISHRFSTVRIAERILYLAGGRIEEEGSHEALIARGGEYARLYQLQAAQYLGHDDSQPPAAQTGGVTEVQR
ncbi:MAG TPA: ABC transporter ATP-binding protein [Chloroflexota bacterium]|nr:ABC transporter ATP-binding protein [Chloroflexota bacterium]